MNGFRVTCPGCAAVLRLNTEPTEKTTLRCPKCQESFKPAENRADDDAPVKSASIKAAPRPAPAPAKPTESSKTSIKTNPLKSKPELDLKKRSDDEDADDESPRKRKRSKKGAKGGLSKGMIIGLSAGGGGLLLVIILIIALSGGGKNDDAKDNKDRQASTDGDKDKQANKDKDKDKIAPVVDKGPEKDGKPNPGPVNPPRNQDGLQDEVLAKVKKATVYIRVTLDGGRQATGSGFFGLSGEYVLTNAHVIGMLDDKAKPPQSIELVMNSGLRDEWSAKAQIVTVDRSSDLALLKGIMPAPGVAWPASLSVVEAENLKETQKVYVFGFPFGEQLGKNITISESSVTSLRRDRGILEKVQVGGGMNPGNSGGPVVDGNGNVVGVAVSIIKGTGLNFAIPGEHVQSLTRGRIAESAVYETRENGGRIEAPMALGLLDPLGAIQEVHIDWWFGPAGDPRPGLDGPAATVAGDGPRTTTKCSYNPAAGKADAVLPVGAMPSDGQVMWTQPHWVDGSGKKRYVSASPQLLTAPVQAVPATLASTPRLSRTRLDIRSTVKMSLREEDVKRSILKNISASFYEDVRDVSMDKKILTYYSPAGRFNVAFSIDGEVMPPSPRVQRIIDDVGNLGLVVIGDETGTARHKTVDFRRVPPPAREVLKSMSDQLLSSLDLGQIPFPAGELIPRQTWSTAKTLPVDLFDDVLLTSFEMRYTYRGVRPAGTQRYAVIELNGDIRREIGRTSSISGVAKGEALFDLGSKRLIQVNLRTTANVTFRFRRDTVDSEAIFDTEIKRGQTGELPISLVSIEEYKDIGKPQPPDPPTPPVAGPAKEIRRFKGADRQPGSFAFSPDGRFFAATSSGTKLVHIWEVSTGKVVNKITEVLEFGAPTLSFSKNGELLLVAGAAGGLEARVYRSSDGSTVRQFKEHSAQIRMCSIGADGSIAATSSNDESVCIWDIKTGKILQRIKPGLRTLNGVALSADLRYCVMSGSATAVYDVKTGSKVKDVNPATGVLVPLPDGKHFLAGGGEGTSRLHEFATAKEVFGHSGHRSYVEQLSVSGDGKYFLTSARDNTVRIWEVRKPAPLLVLSPNNYGVITLSGDGKYFASCNAGTEVILYELPKK